MKNLSCSLLFILLFSLSAISYSENKIIDTNPDTNTDINANTKDIIVAGGCFWCVESDYEKLEGVLKAESGYINGNTPNPTYQQVVTKKTGHFEAVKITYDPSKISIQALTEYYWKTIDPTDPYGQFCDKGSPYKTALFYQDDDQKTVFSKSLEQLKKNKPFAMDIVTEILPAATFYLAEE